MSSPSRRVSFSPHDHGIGRFLREKPHGQFWHRFCLRVNSLLHNLFGLDAFTPMHAGELLELSAIIANQNHVLKSCSFVHTDWAAEQFWAISKARLNHWALAIRTFQDELHRGSDQQIRRIWVTAEPIIEEILLAEPSTRVWCATLAILDAEKHPGELDPIARSVYVGMLEARRRALRLLVFGRNIASTRTMYLNHLRRDCEYWSDVFLANLVPSRIARQFAFDVQRVKEIIGMGQVSADSRRSSERWSAQLATLRFYLSAYEYRAPVCAELNAQLCAHILQCLPSECFDSCGTLRPSWYQLPFESDLAVTTSVAAELFGTSHVNRLIVPPAEKRR